jgi:threonine dehydrogenase-like Zn-dependent dehydrogenase
LNSVIGKNNTVMGAVGPTIYGIESAIRLIESREYPKIESLVTHTFPVEDAHEALRTLDGAYPERRAMNVVIVPRSGS